MLTFILLIIVIVLVVYIIKTRNPSIKSKPTVRYKDRTDVANKQSTVVDDPVIDEGLSALPPDEIMLFSSEFKNRYILEELNNKNKKIELFGTHISVGRSVENQVVFIDSQVSDKHFLIEIIPGYPVKITDLESSNGTFVNGARVQEAWLSKDDLIQLGHIELKFTKES